MMATRFLLHQYGSPRLPLFFSKEINAPKGLPNDFFNAQYVVCRQESVIHL